MCTDMLCSVGQLADYLKPMWFMCTYMLCSVGQLADYLKPMWFMYIHIIPQPVLLCIF